MLQPTHALGVEHSRFQGVSCFLGEVGSERGGTSSKTAAILHKILLGVILGMGVAFAIVSAVVLTSAFAPSLLGIVPTSILSLIGSMKVGVLVPVLVATGGVLGGGISVLLPFRLEDTSNVAG